MTCATLEDVLSDLTTAAESESLAQFAQGDVLALACEPQTLADMGYRTQGAFLADAGSAVGLGQRALLMRLKVARTFAAEQRDPTLKWMTHYHAARTENPIGWLELAGVNQWSPTDIQAAIRADKAHDDDSETLVVARARVAHVVSVSGGNVALAFEGKVPDVRVGEDVVVTIAVDRIPVQVAAPTQEAK
jgi:hypothetical protein